MCMLYINYVVSLNLPCAAKMRTIDVDLCIYVCICVCLSVRVNITYMAMAATHRKLVVSCRFFGWGSLQHAHTHTLYIYIPTLLTPSSSQTLLAPPCRSPPEPNVYNKLIVIMIMKIIN